MFKLQASILPGCFEVYPKVFEDERGRFIKTFHAPSFDALGLCTDFVEEYYSVSHKGVIRGMHFQLPPHDHFKLVYCSAGVVMDVVLDLRKGSPTFGRHAVFELSADKSNMIYIPKGMAHGFCVLSDNATMMYKVTSIYAPDCDYGIRWDSAEIDWPSLCDISLLSDRDKSFVSLSDFDSPFDYSEGHRSE
jgi:dTDP-4-dehydrorhamnose 3,5-epimerase